MDSNFAWVAFLLLINTIMFWVVLLYVVAGFSKRLDNWELRNSMLSNSMRHLSHTFTLLHQKEIFALRSLNVGSTNQSSDNCELHKDSSTQTDGTNSPMPEDPATTSK